MSEHVHHVHITLLPLLCFIRAYGLSMYKYMIGRSFSEQESDLLQKLKNNILLLHRTNSQYLFNIYHMPETNLFYL